MKITRDSDNDVILNIPQGSHLPYLATMGRFYDPYLAIRVGVEGRKVFFTKEDILKLAELFDDT